MRFRVVSVRFFILLRCVQRCRVVAHMLRARPTPCRELHPRRQRRRTRPFAAVSRLPAHLRHYLHINDLSRAELDAVLLRAASLKRAFRANDHSFEPLKGLTMSMIFAKPSLRTRVSFEAARRARPACSNPHPLLVRRASPSWAATQSTSGPTTSSWAAGKKRGAAGPSLAPDT